MLWVVVLYYNAFYVFLSLQRFLSLWESRFSLQVCCRGITCISGMPGQLWALTLPAMSLCYLSLLLCTWWLWSSRWDCLGIYANPLKTEYSSRTSKWQLYCLLILSNTFCTCHLTKEYLISWRWILLFQPSLVSKSTKVILLFKMKGVHVLKYLFRECWSVWQL